MRTTARILVLAAALSPALATQSGAASAEPVSVEVMQLSMSEIAADNGGAESGLSVSGAGGRYDRIAAPAVPVMLALSGRPAPNAANVKILKSELLLKTEGSSAVLDTMAGTAPVEAIDARQAYNFAISAMGPVAQAAIAACNGLASAGRSSAARTVDVNLAVTWRVTSGRFNFKWTNYDRVAPSDEIINNRDFYSDQRTTLVDATVTAPVVCQPLTDAPAVAKAASQPVVQAAYVAPEVVAAPVVTKSPAAKPVEAAAVTTASPVTTASIDGGNGKPQCDGGMVRQLSSGTNNYLCLCPGNTERIATGENAFACEKRSRKR